MKLIFVRHGDPNYKDDCLTEKGRREAAALAERASCWNVDKIFCSPLGRAQETASYCQKKWGKEAVTYDWLREFSAPVMNPHIGRKKVPWDFMPSYWTGQPEFYDKDHWFEAQVLKDSEVDIQKYYEEVCTGLDGILEESGYRRKNGFYFFEEHSDEVIVFFCHLGVSYVCLSHLLGIAPSVLWHTFFSAPASVTILGSEERLPHEAGFRCQVLGDTRHLAAAGEPISPSGYFTEVFQD